VIGAAALARRATEFLKTSTRKLQAPPKEPLWSIGVYEGGTPLDWKPASGIVNPVLARESVTDVSAEFVADPFAVCVGGVWHLFFEIMNRAYWRGEIGWATSADFRRWSYQQIVLREPFHVSYPYVFEWDGEFYMVPEAYRTNTIRLYKADEFPTQWKLVEVLANGACFSDSSLFHHAGKWWLLTETNPDFRFDTLRLFWAETLRGPWREHPCSPVVRRNPHIARPGGRVISWDGRLVRFAQDCHPRYGLQVLALEILELGPTSYRERPLGRRPILTGDGAGWNRYGMHHIDAHQLAEGQWMAVVDGW